MHTAFSNGGGCTQDVSTVVAGGAVVVPAVPEGDAVAEAEGVGAAVVGAGDVVGGKVGGGVPMGVTRQLSVM